MNELDNLNSFMKYFLIQWTKNHRVKGYYNGTNMVCIHPLDTKDLTGYTSIFEYGFFYLVNSFKELSYLEQAVLESYIYYSTSKKYTPLYEDTKPESMYSFLEDYKANNTIKGYYHNGYVFVSTKRHEGIKNFIPIETMDYDYLLRLFPHLTKLERETLRNYFKQNKTRL